MDVQVIANPFGQPPWLTQRCTTSGPGVPTTSSTPLPGERAPLGRQGLPRRWWHDPHPLPGHWDKLSAGRRAENLPALNSALILVTVEEFVRRGKAMAEHFSPAEQIVIAAFARGATVDLPGDELNRTVRAEVLTRLLTGSIRVAQGSRPALRLIGAHITGPFDLAGVSVTAPIKLEQCLFDEIGRAHV